MRAIANDRRPPVRVAPTVNSSVVTLHGRQVHYVRGGSGPVLLLLHGMACDLHTWDGILPALVSHHEVIAVDLPGHGRSDKPRCDYSPAALANVVRDLLRQLGHDRVTVVGHSFGGGVATQLAYQFPGLVERLVLVASGGLGLEVSSYLRALSLPGAPAVLAAVACGAAVSGSLSHTVAAAAPMTGILLSSAVSALPPPVREHWLCHLVRHGVRTCRTLAAADTREAFVRTLRSAVDGKGQRIDGRSRVHAIDHLPTLLLWGDADSVIPAQHGIDAVREVWTGAELHLVSGAGHLVHLDHYQEVARVLCSFLERTLPSAAADWRRPATSPTA